MGLNVKKTIVVCIMIFPFLSAAPEDYRYSRGRGSTYFRRAPVSEQLQLDTGKLIIDTDAGSDDAAAILLALSQERYNANFKVFAITCVDGNAALEDVVVNVLKTLKTANRLDIPVYKGAAKSLVSTPPTDNYFGKDGFGDFEFPDPPDVNQYLQKEHAVNALVRMVIENPGQITLLCVGPLTNIALAIRMYPDFLTYVKQLVVMGGSVEGVGNAKPNIEFNFFIDPVASFVVFNSTDTTNGTVNPMILIPWESGSIRNTITMDWRKTVLGSLLSPEIQLLNQAEHYQLETEYTWVSMDCLAAGVVVDPSIVTGYISHYAFAIPEGSYTAGAVFVDYMDKTQRSVNTKIIQHINVETYKQLLLTRFGGSYGK